MVICSGGGSGTLGTEYSDNISGRSGGQQAIIIISLYGVQYVRK